MITILECNKKNEGTFDPLTFGFIDYEEEYLKLLDSIRKSWDVMHHTMIDLEEFEDQSWYWTKEWQDAEKEADEDYAKGNFKTFNNIDDLLAHLS